MNDSSYAFEFVKGATLPMILGNGAAVGFAIIIVSFLSHENFFYEKGNERIAHTFQRWLLACIVIAYFVTSSFTYILQNGMVKIETQKVFTAAIGDVEADIKGKSDAYLLGIAKNVKKQYENNPNVSLDSLLEDYELKEINVVNDEGLIINSTEEDVINQYDMNSKAQSKEFVDKLKVQDSFVQEYGLRGKDGSVWRKYAAVNLKEEGFIQVGYDAKQFHKIINEFVIDVTKNRHVGTNGFVVVCDETLALVSDNKYSGAHVSSIGIDPPEEMKQGRTATALYYTEITDSKVDLNERYIYVFKFVEGYCIIAAMPESEAMLMRDASLYTSVFMQVLIFAALFIFIYILIKRVIIDNLNKINETLGKIAEGDLNVIVDVRSNEEFSSLSDDINSTVSTLKKYIEEAAARIDKELEYAKQIQLSALPTNFPTREEYDIYAQMIAAKEVGGDFYDFYKLNDTTVALLAADVSGKGIPAAMFMMTPKTIIKDLAERGMSVDEIFTSANEKLCENNESGMFVTAWMGIMDVTTGTMMYANAGHNPPLLKRANGSFEYLKSRPGFVLAGMEGICYRAGELVMNPGDRLFLYTDGVTEATDATNELYGEDRLLAYMNQNATVEARVLLPALKYHIDEFVGEAPQFDDMTMLMFDYKPKMRGAQMMTKTFSARVEALTDVLAFVEETMEQHDCPVGIQMAVCVAIEEAFVNVAHYAYGDVEGDVDLRIGFEEDTRTFTFCIADKGIPFDPLQKPDPDITLSAEERQIGGLGIFITKKTMDAVAYAYENGENILTMVKKI